VSNKLYTVVRQDMIAGQRIVQTAHAVSDWVQAYPNSAAHWQHESNTMIVLGVNDEHTLRALFGVVKNLGQRAEAFYEPDMGGAMTAFTVLFDPYFDGLFSHLPLAQ
jgi:peptidyl-tRNA hydrolase